MGTLSVNFIDNNNIKLTNINLNHKQLGNKDNIKQCISM